MDIHTNIPLKNYTTMRLGGPARFMTEVHTAEEVDIVVRNAVQQNLPLFVLGDGSNVVVKDDGFNGIVVRNRIPGFDIIYKNSTTVSIKIGAGEDWDSVVKRSVDMHLTGIESLSAIPGTSGAAPVQNIGAYGQEIADTLDSLEAYDKETNTIVTLRGTDCKFSYRDSIFRGKHAGRYIILNITLTLFKSNPTPPFYGAVQEYFDAHNISVFTPAEMRLAVVAIRQNKLPDPKIHPNAGSFFKNSIIESWQLDELRNTYPDIPSFDMGNGTFKIPTGWLIEKTGLKGETIRGIKVHDKNALVLINESAASYADLRAAKETVAGAVRDTFRITLEQEPLEM